MFGKKKAKPVKRVAPRILETKFTCHACGRVWHIENVQQVAKLNRAAQMSNVGRSLTPILWLTKPKQTIDLRHCPSCGSVELRKHRFMQVACRRHKASHSQRQRKNTTLTLVVVLKNGKRKLKITEKKLVFAVALMTPHAHSHIPDFDVSAHESS